MIMCCPSVPGPAKWPKRVPRRNLSLPVVGSSSEMRTSIFWVRSPQHFCRLKISTLSIVTLTLKSMATQGAGSALVWHIGTVVPSQGIQQGSPGLRGPNGPSWSSISPSMHLSAEKSRNVDDWVAVTGWRKSTPVNWIYDGSDTDTDTGTAMNNLAWRSWAASGSLCSVYDPFCRTCN